MIQIKEKNTGTHGGRFLDTRIFSLVTIEQSF